MPLHVIISSSRTLASRDVAAVCTNGLVGFQMPVQVPLLPKADTRPTVAKKTAFERTFIGEGVCLPMFAKRSKLSVGFLGGKELRWRHT